MAVDRALLLGVISHLETGRVGEERVSYLDTCLVYSRNWSIHRSRICRGPRADPHGYRGTAVVPS